VPDDGDALAPDDARMVLVDITARKEAEGRLQAALLKAQELETIIERSPVMVFLWGVADGWPVEYASGNVRQLGYSAEDFVSGRISWPGITHPDDVPRLEAEVAGYLESGTNEFVQQYRLIRRDGEVRWMQDNTRTVRDRAGNVTHVQGLILDITDRKKAEQAHAASEARFRTIFDNDADGLFLIDVSARLFVLANRACLDMLGYTMEEFAALRLDDLHLPEDLPYIHGLCARFSRVKNVPPADVRFKRKDGSLILIEVHPISMHYGSQDYVLVSIRDVTERRRMEKDLMQSRETLRGLLSRLERAREEERTRIARDIHDDLGQNLTAIKMDLGWIGRKLEKLGGSPELAAVRARAASAIEVVAATTATVQELATELRPVVLDHLGLGPAIRFELQRFQSRYGIVCRVSVSDAFPDPGPAVATALFRILQECLTNVARHSGASRTSVRLGVQGNDFLLRVHDNGCGITEEVADCPQSLGLLGMKERAAILGGGVVIRPNKNGGTVVTVRVPSCKFSTGSVGGLRV
jgi:PAS domain S-box-containing protein